MTKAAVGRERQRRRGLTGARGALPMMALLVAAQLVLVVRPSFAFPIVWSTSSPSAAIGIPPAAPVFTTPQQKHTTRLEEDRLDETTNNGVSGALETNDPLKRSLEISSALLGDVVGPSLVSLLQQGWPVDGDEFWSRSRVDGKNLAEHAASTLEKLGPTYVKFGQALSARADVVPPALAEALSKLQDDMATTFDAATAKGMIRRELSQKKACSPVIVNALIDSLSEEPVGAASIAQVYKSHLPGYGPVAIKVQRPGIRELVQQDTALLLKAAHFLESLPALPVQTSGSKNASQRDGPKTNRLVATKLVQAVDEFMSRVTEELDYGKEVDNMAKFARLYSHRTGSSENVNVVVPEVLTELCTENTIFMEWIEGTKLTEFQAGDDSLAENLAILESASAATLAQLFDEGVLHADPHSGNLLKVRMGDKVMLGYLDYGMVSTIPEQVRDGLVCAVAQMVFAHNTEAVALLFAELQLLKQETLDDPIERKALIEALDNLLNDVFDFPDDAAENGTKVPTLKFDSLLGGLSLLVARFEFELPPYFINNARALATLEGLTRKLDPNYNSMKDIYPVALRRLFHNPSGNPVVEKTLLDLARDPVTKVATVARVTQLIDQIACLSGNKRRRVVKDILKTRGGRRMVRKIGREVLRAKLSRQPTQRRRRREIGRPLFKL